MTTNPRGRDPKAKKPRKKRKPYAWRYTYTKASAVKVTHVDGSIEFSPPYSPRELGNIVNPNRPRHPRKPLRH